jgi:hypothetical protein
VQADEKLSLSRGQASDGVEIPHFLEECFSHRAGTLILALRFSRVLGLARGMHR